LTPVRSSHSSIAPTVITRLPCDYADATLIELAERSGVTVIATVDQRDFSVYRLRGRKRFRIVLGQ
jgi:predicted nucleic acid-binding protein